MSRPDPDVLTAHTLTLLSRAAIDGVCRKRMRALVAALDAVADHPGVAAEVRTACRALHARWHAAEVEHFAGDAAQAPRAVH